MRRSTKVTRRLDPEMKRKLRLAFYFKSKTKGFSYKKACIPYLLTALFSIPISAKVYFQDNTPLFESLLLLIYTVYTTYTVIFSIAFK